MMEDTSLLPVRNPQPGMSPADFVDPTRLRSARFLALGSWVVNFGCQLYGMLASPNMKEVADANHYSFSPQPMFIAAFFSLQTVIQLYWISRLFKATPETAGRLGALDYVPIYALGNLCIAGWMVFWMRESFVGSQILVTINSFAQLMAITRLPLITHDNLITHLVAKTFAGIGVLDFLDNGAVALRYGGVPSVAVQALVGGALGFMALTGDPIFGACLVYDLVGIYFGQPAPWSTNLAWMAVAIGCVVVLKSFVFKIY